MLSYVLRRLVNALSVVLVTLVASFCLFYIAPTDPGGVICGPRCTPARLHDIEQSLSLDKPVGEQLLLYMKGLAAGRDYVTDGTDRHCAAPCLGYSYQLGVPVTKLIAQALPVTVSIVLGSAAVYLLAGVLAGSLSAQVRGTPLDWITVGTTQILSSLPYFVVALIVAIYATFLPRPEYHPFFSNPLAWAAGLLSAWLTSGIVNASAYARFSRSAMIEALGQDHIRTARASGLSRRRVVYRHALRVALTPVVTIFGIDVASQLSGVLMTERIFGLPGLGNVTLNAFNNYDLPVLMGATLVGSTLVVFMNLAVDIGYTFLDPRVRLT